MKTNRVVISILSGCLGVFAMACSENIEKARKTQDERLEKEGKAVVLAEYKRRHESNPKDPGAVYLYARLLSSDLELQAKLAQGLVADHPSFPWGHFLMRSVLRDQGDYERSLTEMEKAAMLEPANKIFSDTLAKDRASVFFTEAVDGAIMIKRTFEAGFEGGEKLQAFKQLVQQTGDYLGLHEHVYGNKRTTVMNVDVVSEASQAESEKALFVDLTVKNRSPQTIQLEGRDVERDQAVACFTEKGMKVGPLVGTRNRNTPDACRACPSNAIQIPPGAVHHVNAYFSTKGNVSLRRCAFYNFPQKEAVLVVKLPNFYKPPEGSHHEPERPKGQTGLHGLKGPKQAGRALAPSVVAGRALAPSVVAGRAEVRGALDLEVIRRIIRLHINEVKYCYQKELMTNPNLQGRVVVQFTIAATGQVVVSKVASSTLKNDAVDSCIAEAVRRWLFPKPKGGGIAIVTYPFVLSANAK